MGDLANLLSFLLRLSRGIRASRWMMLGIVVAGILGGLANTALIALFNSVLAGKTGTHGRIPVFLALCAALPAFRLLSQSMLIRLSQKSMLELRVGMCRRILAAPMRHLEQIGPHRLLTTLTTDLTQIVEGLTLIPVLFLNLSIVLSCLAYLGWLSWSLLAQIFGFLVVGVITYSLPMRRALRHFARSRQIMDTLIKHMRAVAEGTKELKMHWLRRESFLTDVRTSGTAMQRETRAGAIIFAAASSWGQTLFFLLVGFLLLVLPRFQSLPLPTLFGFTLVLFHMMTPLEVLLSSFPTLGRAAVSARAVERMGLNLEAVSFEHGSSSRPAILPAWGRLELAGVCHSYRREGEAETFQLGPVDLVFEPGELVFFVGGNGSGKTTLAKLLLGLYPPESGEILFGGKPVTDESRDAYREHFAVVFSDFFLFEKLVGTGQPEIDEEARQLAVRLRLAEKVRIENGTLSTLELSQGQRKRLALLGAFLEDRPIYLFDEWAADQDPVFKEVFYLELLPELKARGKTVLVISHDDRYYGVAERIIKLEDGRVASDQTMPDRPADRLQTGAGR
jgi:putative ATP-binding cassette transporter